MNIKVIVFDLDDTLYNEIDYVSSGLKEVAAFFSKQHNLKEQNLYELMLKELETYGRGKVFDNIFKSLGVYSKKNIQKALSIYRQHRPNISLSNDAHEILNYFRDYPLYIVTDGNKLVQQKKIEALKLQKYFKKCFITHRYGIKHSKPSTYCFEKIAKLEKVSFEEVVYVADNINKDFVNINRLGFKTFRILNGMFKDVKRPKEYHAKHDLLSLLELKEYIKESLK